MMALSLAAIAGVPAGIALGAHFQWEAPFVLLTVLSLLIWLGASRVVPSLADHLSENRVPLRQVFPALWHLLSNPAHIKAFSLTFVMMVAHMMVIPFISPTLVANHGVSPVNLAWMYMAGGASTLFSSRMIGKLADRFDRKVVFRSMVAVSFIPALFMTHMPDIPFIGMVVFFPFFMMSMSGRLIPMSVLQTTVPEPAHRGAFLSANSAVQALGTGTGAWFGGLFLSTTAAGQIDGYGTVGLVAVAVASIGLILVGRVQPYVAPNAVDDIPAEAQVSEAG
jgi:predicted MFS family arabinose efflux permease